jgi:hypothetical protein
MEVFIRNVDAKSVTAAVARRLSGDPLLFEFVVWKLLLNEDPQEDDEY